MTSNHPNNLQTRVLQAIDEKRITPTSAWYFLARSVGVLLLWGLSVLLGAVAVAITLLVILYQRYTLYEVTHGSLLAIWYDTLPFLWLLVFTAGLALAVFYQKHFRRGYRHSLSFVLLTCAGASIVLGISMYLANVGLVVDTLMGQHVPFYTSQLKYQDTIWQQPAAGRLVGVQRYTTLASTSTVIFTDVDQFSWQLRTEELSNIDQALLATAVPVRIWGVIDGNNQYVFHACAVWPWQQEEKLSRTEMLALRQNFETRRAQPAPGVISPPDSLAVSPAIYTLTATSSEHGDQADTVSKLSQYCKDFFFQQKR